MTLFTRALAIRAEITSVVVVRVNVVPFSEGDPRVLAPSRRLFDCGPGVGFPGRGTVSPECRISGTMDGGLSISDQKNHEECLDCQSGMSVGNPPNLRRESADELG
ncbi:hypothetical protein BHM03_00051331 [Ensete ventricosum]|nr:hypothetical protein BHM03_00051331 [Ensete ventricosum]